jgi:hypothetical protein
MPTQGNQGNQGGNPQVTQEQTAAAAAARTDAARAAWQQRHGKNTERDMRADWWNRTKVAKAAREPVEPYEAPKQAPVAKAPRKVKR